MNPQTEQLKAALKAVAQARREGKPIDLHGLPEPLRQKLQAQLDKLPPELRQQLLDKGSPILDRAIERAAPTIAAKSASAPTASLIQRADHYNRTVQPGDRLHLSVGWVLLIGGAGLAYYLLYL